jgi:hypothetical protein
MNLSDIDTDTVAIAAVIIVVMFVSMRLLYGYWPWQTSNRQSYKRGYAAGAADVAYARETSEARINASDFPYTDPPVAQDTSDDHFERPAQAASRTNNMPPVGPTRTEENI